MKDKSVSVLLVDADVVLGHPICQKMYPHSASSGQLYTSAMLIYSAVHKRALTAA